MPGRARTTSKTVMSTSNPSTTDCPYSSPPIGQWSHRNPRHNDGHNLLFRAGFGIPAEIFSRDAEHRDITTQFMFPALLRKGIRDELESWPEVLVVFDGENGSNARKDVDEDYKANRPDPFEAQPRNPSRRWPT